MDLRTSVRPEGRFEVALHKPSYAVTNLRAHEWVAELGRLRNGQPVTNHQNFPSSGVAVPSADGVYEIANPFPFRGTTFIGKAWADGKRRDPALICLPSPPSVSMSQWIRDQLPSGSSGSGGSGDLLASMPEPVQLALAVNSTDPEDLVHLAEAAGEFIHDPETGEPAGLRYTSMPDGDWRPWIHRPALFEAVANNANLPDSYKDVMVLRPGAQGGSEIVGEWRTEGGSHVFEYLRRNSYIPWGHYAANMANDAVRYRPEALTMADMTGMRHLYYQRTFIRLAEMIGLSRDWGGGPLSPADLETLRCRIRQHLDSPNEAPRLVFNGALWGWNFGFDYAPSHYRLHASHQQIHQQYALIPRETPTVETTPNGRASAPAYACGDQIHAFLLAYREAFGVEFFRAYIEAIRNNRRTDGDPEGDQALIVYRDERVMLFVPKAQTSQWELQLVSLAPVGNILEADESTRRSLDKALLVALQTLARMGGRMMTVIEYSKRFDCRDSGQHLLYSVLPRLPESPGAFSEAQQRWIIGHYPEDFATICRAHRPALAFR